MPIQGRHTAENLSKLIENAVKEYLSDGTKIHILIRDAANVMKKLARLCELESFDCFAHQLQIGIYGGLKILDDQSFKDLI
jgi:hypothetical protein